MSIDSDLFSLYSKGIFPGPSESLNNFLLRAGSLSSKDNVDSSGAIALVNSIFHVSPDWVQVTIDSQGLLPWEGAAAWIEESSDGARSCTIQLKDSWITRLYSKNEVVAHEMVHAMRLMFDESRFEEILAYQTSKNRLRRYFGPLFSSPKESKFFVGLCALSWLLFLAEIAWDINIGGVFILLAPLIALGWGVSRLIRSQRIFSNALRNLEKVVGIGKPRAAALCLTDCEIEQFAKWSPKEIFVFASNEKERSSRWCQIYHRYFSPPCQIEI